MRNKENKFHKDGRKKITNNQRKKRELWNSRMRHLILNRKFKDLKHYEIRQIGIFLKKDKSRYLSFVWKRLKEEHKLAKQIRNSDIFELFGEDLT